MSKRQWLMVFGVWVMVFLFLGFPFFWKKAIAVITGLLIIVISYRQSQTVHESRSDKHLPYVEHKSEVSIVGDKAQENEITKINLQ